MRTQATHSLHRWTRWVLAAWLCVALASVLAPWARAQTAAVGMEPVCSASGGMHWVASPVAQLLADDAAPAVHGMDCPLCLPLLAPPPATAKIPVPRLALPAQTLSAPTAPWVRQAAAPLPARGPPLQGCADYS